MTKKVRKRAPKQQVNFYAVQNTVIFEQWGMGMVFAKRLSLPRAVRFLVALEKQVVALRKACTSARKYKGAKK